MIRIRPSYAAACMPGRRLPRLETSVLRTARVGALGAIAGLGALACAEKLPPSGVESGVAVPDGFVRVGGERFVVGGKPLAIMGQNYWSAAADSRTPEGRARVARELDHLRAMGVNVLRIMALSEGPDSEPWRVRPSLQPAPGVLAADGLAGLDWLMHELAAREMYGIFTLNNFWFWSGGMAQYVAWAQEEPIPYPIPDSGDWDRYQRFAVRFFSDEKARALFQQALAQVLVRYTDSPAIFAWELANEPRGLGEAERFRAWIDETARYVESLDPGHLITTGTEGDTDAPAANGLDVTLDHASPAIDFISFHVWPDNWGWTQAGSSLDSIAERTRRYIGAQAEKAHRLGKPALLLETGLPRDGGDCEPTAPVSARDRFLEVVFQSTLESIQEGGALAGAFPWAWSGESRPEAPGQLADSRVFLGDPPHERQGWYSIYASDSSTVALIRRYAARMADARR
jgi:mannan endo-1,4-beta-mannosidase